jgi:hypothetical protein
MCLNLSDWNLFPSWRSGSPSPKGATMSSSTSPAVSLTSRSKVCPITYKNAKMENLELLQTVQNCFVREGVGSSKIRTSKVFLGLLEHRKIRTSKIRMSKRTSTVKKDFWCSDLFDAIGNIRMSNVFGSFSTQNLFDVLILPMESKKIRTSKV